MPGPVSNRRETVPDELLKADMSDILDKLAEVLESRKDAEADTSYVASLYARGLDTILKKVGEEAVETVIAAHAGEKAPVVYETADLWFHSLVMLSHLGIDHRDVLAELERRFGLSGLEEKASRGG